MIIEIKFRCCFAGIILLAQFGSAQVKPDVIVFDEDDSIGAGYYDASVPSVVSPSVLTTVSSPTGANLPI
jgi:hypothetical protein